MKAFLKEFLQMLREDFRWSDIPPLSALALVWSIWQSIAHYNPGWVVAAIWIFSSIVGAAMVKVSNRDLDEWKQLAIDATDGIKSMKVLVEKQMRIERAGALLDVEVCPGKMTVVRPARGQTLEESQAAIDQIMTEVRKLKQGMPS